MVILLVNQHTVPIFVDIANAFAKAGHDVKLFTGHVEKGGQPLSPAIKVIQSIRYQRKSSVSRLFSWVAFSIHYFFYLLVCRKPSHILVVTNPPLGPLVTAFVSWWRRLSYHVLLYDLYPEAFVQAGLIKENNFAYRLWKRWNYTMFRNVKKVFTLSDSMKGAVGKYLPHSSEKIRVIHNWADMSYIHPVPKAENIFVKNHHLENKLVVMYSGNMGLTHDLESLIGAADLVKEINEIVFVLIGDGGKRKKLEQLTKQLGLGNVIFLPYQNADQFPYAMAAADIGVVTLGIGAEGISVPSKTYINLAAGACLLGIAPASSELNRLIVTHDAGGFCEPGHPEEVAAVLTSLFHDHQKLFNYKQNALKASTQYTIENANLYIRGMMEN